MVRFHWPVESAKSAFISPGGNVLDASGVRHLSVEMEMETCPALFTVPGEFLTEGEVRPVGVVLAHGADADDWRGRLLEGLAVALARQGYFVARSTCRQKDQRRQRIFEKTFEAAATFPAALGVVKDWVLVGHDNGARIAAVVAGKARVRSPGLVFLSYPLLEPAPPPPKQKAGAVPPVDSVPPLRKLAEGGSCRRLLFVTGERDLVCPGGRLLRALEEIRAEAGGGSGEGGEGDDGEDDEGGDDGVDEAGPEGGTGEAAKTGGGGSEGGGERDPGAALAAAQPPAAETPAEGPAPDVPPPSAETPTSGSPPTEEPAKGPAPDAPPPPAEAMEVEAEAVAPLDVRLVEIPNVDGAFTAPGGWEVADSALSIITDSILSFLKAIEEGRPASELPAAPSACAGDGEAATAAADAPSAAAAAVAPGVVAAALAPATTAPGERPGALDGGASAPAAAA